MADDPPVQATGCLGCNEESVRTFLEALGIDVSRFAEVPPHHDMDDAICCEECGRAWLVKPVPTGRRAGGRG